ncbi:hypothetical protein ACPUEN_16785 [Algoriphagus yeomjeoni]|uniref:hypothetical protein n=1 Tax=Algoriphagus yeomjeoni TaxID=291403 RepID=UPI003CE4C8BE
MIRFPLVLFVLLFSSSGYRRADESNEMSGQRSAEIYIVFNRYQADTEFIDRSTPEKESFQYLREGFYDPNLHIRVSHDIDFQKKVITRKGLDSKVVWFDQEMEYTDWFHLSSLETYYVIFEDDYLVKGSLDPDHEFEVYEVGISTGGIE